MKILLSINMILVLKGIFLTSTFTDMLGGQYKDSFSAPENTCTGQRVPSSFYVTLRPLYPKGSRYRPALAFLRLHYEDENFLLYGSLVLGLSEQVFPTCSFPGSEGFRVWPIHMTNSLLKGDILWAFKKTISLKHQKTGRHVFGKIPKVCLF